jgi:hypothetical protein
LAPKRPLSRAQAAVRRDASNDQGKKTKPKSAQKQGGKVDCDLAPCSIDTLRDQQVRRVLMITRPLGVSIRSRTTRHAP